MFYSRLQNSRFFLKISKEIGVASVFSLIPDLLFDCSSVLEYAKIRTVLQSSFILFNARIFYSFNHAASKQTV